MAALHKFKLFASHCGVAQSPAKSPRGSPLVELRRPKTTLRTLLSLRCGSARAPQEAPLLQEKKGKDDLMRRHSLRDLFVSSPPRDGDGMGHHASSASTSASVGVGVVNMGLGGPGSWAGSSNSVWRGFRCRSSLLLKRKAWRPLLLTIPEDDH